MRTLGVSSELKSVQTVETHARLLSDVLPIYILVDFAKIREKNEKKMKF